MATITEIKTRASEIQNQMNELLGQIMALTIESEDAYQSATSETLKIKLAKTEELLIDARKNTEKAIDSLSYIQK